MSNMSKKHFEALASMIYHMRGAKNVSEPARRVFALYLARELWNMSRKFDKARFLKACDVDLDQ